MRGLKLNPYIKLGSSIRYLLDVREGLPIKKTLVRGEPSLVSHLNLIESLLLQLKLPVTYQAFQGELSQYLGALKKSPETSTLTAQQAYDLVERIRIVSDVLKYESANLQAYIVAEKRLPIDKLLSDVSGLFGEFVFAALPDLSQYDFIQAGRCIAFDLPTAAAFHVLRATEGVLRSYHSLLISEAIPTQQMLWGPIVSRLREIKDDPPPKELLDNLDNIRVSFRNPTQQPDKRYDLDEAQDLFNLCIDVENRMAKDLFSRNIWEEEEDIPF